MPPARDVPRTPQGEQLLLPDEQISGLAHQTHRRSPRLHPAGALPERGPRFSARSPGGSLHLPAEEPPHLGNHAPLRRKLRHLRLVRRPDQLRHRDRVPGRRELPEILAGGRAPDRQGHPETPRDLLADDAQGRRDRTRTGISTSTATGTSTRARCPRAWGTSSNPSTSRTSTASTPSAIFCSGTWSSASTPASARRPSSSGSTRIWQTTWGTSSAGR